MVVCELDKKGSEEGGKCLSMSGELGKVRGRSVNSVRGKVEKRL